MQWNSVNCATLFESPTYTQRVTVSEFIKDGAKVHVTFSTRDRLAFRKLITAN